MPVVKQHNNRLLQSVINSIIHIVGKVDLNKKVVYLEKKIKEISGAYRTAYVFELARVRFIYVTYLRMRVRRIDSRL